MPRIDRFVEPLHHGIDYMKHRVEDMYDATPSVKPTFFERIFGYKQQPSYAQQFGQMGAGKLAKKAAQAVTGLGAGYGYGQQHGYGGHGQHRGWLGGYEEEPSFFEAPLQYIENSIFNSTIGPLLFVAWPLMLGLFISSWAHKQIRNNRAWYDKISLPGNVPPSWLYDPMWTVVLTSMGYAAWLVFSEGGFGNWISLGVYNTALIMLVSWPLVFFSLHDSVAAPILGTILSLTMFVTAGLFFMYSGTASFLMTFASLWTTYMTIVNWQVYSKNVGLSRVGKEKSDWPWSATAAGTTAPVSAEAKKVR